MQLFITTITGDTIILDNPQKFDTVWDIKKRIEMLINVPAETQRLLFGTKFGVNKRFIRHYDTSKIFLRVSTRQVDNLNKISKGRKTNNLYE